MVHRRSLLGSLLAGALAAPRLSWADDSVAFFGRGAIPRLRLELAPDQEAKIREGNRPYVRAALIENDGTVWRDVAVKLKGAAGSSRPWEDRPALTINVDKFRKGQAFHGLDKFHLNNSVQDDGYLHEWISSEIIRAAGYPAARVTHARVWLNGRDVGLYVLKEGFDKGFLKRAFADPSGNLYDGGFVQDIDANLERDEGKGPDDHADLKALVDACRQPNPAERWRQVSARLNVGAFLTFMALERMLCHWDGYCLNVNNYRVYCGPDGKAVFLPHGMDQMLGQIDMSLFDMPRSLVGSTVLQNPAWRQAYRKRVKELSALFAPADVFGRLDAVSERVGAVRAQIQQDGARVQFERVEDLKRRFAMRAQNIVGQLNVPEPPPPQTMRFDASGVAIPTEWKKVSQVADTRLELGNAPDGVRAYSIRVGGSGVCVASWRSTVVLGPGVYTFRARCRTRDVVALEEGPTSAAGIRISGATRTERMEGVADRELAFEFSVQDEQREVVLVAELRGAKGQVWFDAASLRLTRQPEAPLEKVPLKPKPPVKKKPAPRKPAAKKPAARKPVR